VLVGVFAWWEERRGELGVLPRVSTMPVNMVGDV